MSALKLWDGQQFTWRSMGSGSAICPPHNVSGIPVVMPMLLVWVSGRGVPGTPSPLRLSARLLGLPSCFANWARWSKQLGILQAAYLGCVLCCGKTIWSDLH